MVHFSEITKAGVKPNVALKLKNSNMQKNLIHFKIWLSKKGMKKFIPKYIFIYSTTTKNKDSVSTVLLCTQNNS